jgi:PleD family two-component response regulator
MPTQSDTKKVVIVNGSANALELVETTLDAGHYDVVFVESPDHAYSQVKRVQPNLVILCLRMDDVPAFRVLSMLKLDADTRGIPVMTYTADCEDRDADRQEPERSDDESFAMISALRMN